MHVVYTRDATGNASFYIDGLPVTVDEPIIDGNLSNWDTAYKLALADEFNSAGGNRYWSGTYHLVAFYSKALSSNEVSQNFIAGLGGSAPTATPTNTPASSTATATPTFTATPTNTPASTATPTNTPPSSNTATPTNTPANSPTPTPTSTPTNTPAASGSLTLNPIADAYVRDGFGADNNYGTISKLYARQSPEINSYFKFNVQGVSQPITSATLRLHVLDNSSVGFDISTLANPSDNSWDELTITYNNAPTIGTILDGVTSTSKNSWVDLDVTNAVTDNGLVTFALTTTQSGSRIGFGSRESTTVPELIINYGTTAQNNVLPNLATGETTADTLPNPTDATAGLLTNNTSSQPEFIPPPAKHAGTMRLATSSYPTFITVQTLHYDAYGNVNWVKDGNNNQTSFAYDATYHLYMVSTTNELGHTQTFGYSKLNASKDDIPLPGLLRETTDPNGLSRLFFYDAFGRLIRKFHTYPGYGGDWAKPVEAIVYHDYGGAILENPPFLISSWRQTQDDGTAWSTGGTWERQFFDGFGNLVQLQRPHTNWKENGDGTGQEVVIDTTYDALGRTISQSVPYFRASYVYTTNASGLVVNPYQTPDVSQPHTTTTYDAANRPVKSVGLGAVKTR